MGVPELGIHGDPLHTTASNRTPESPVPQDDALTESWSRAVRSMPGYPSRGLADDVVRHSGNFRT